MAKIKKFINKDGYMYYKDPKTSFKEWYKQDENGHNVYYKNSDGVEWEKKYNNDGQVIYHKKNGVEIVQYTLDDLGRISEIIEGDIIKKYQYDTDFDFVRVKEFIGNYKTTYLYNKKTNQVKYIYIQDLDYTSQPGLNSNIFFHDIDKNVIVSSDKYNNELYYKIGLNETWTDYDKDGTIINQLTKRADTVEVYSPNGDKTSYPFFDIITN